MNMTMTKLDFEKIAELLANYNASNELIEATCSMCYNINDRFDGSRFKKRIEEIKKQKEYKR